MNANDIVALYDEHDELSDARFRAFATILQSFYDKIFDLGIEVPDEFDWFSTLLLDMNTGTWSQYYQNKIVDVSHHIMTWSWDVPSRDVTFQFAYACEKLYRLMIGYRSQFDKESLCDTLGNIANLLNSAEPETDEQGYIIRNLPDGYAIVYHMMKDQYARFT